MTLSQCFKVPSLILAAALVASFSLVDHASAQTIPPPLYRPYLVDLSNDTVTPIGTLSGGASYAGGINDAGQVVGWSAMEGVDRAFITGPDGMGMRDLGTLGGAYSRAYDINEAGQVVGVSETAEGDTHAFITGPGGVGMRDIGTVGPFEVLSINGVGQVVGDFYTTEQDVHAFITGPDGADRRDLGTLGGSFSIPQDINNAGQVVGSSDKEGSLHPFITGPDGMGMRSLGTLGGFFNAALGINDAGQVVGASPPEPGSGFPSHAFITGPNSAGMRDLGTLGGNESYAEDINDAGQAVGWSFMAEGPSHAFITGPDGEGMSDLNSLVDLPEGVVLTNATDINNNGQVIALGIPEPETYALMLAGLCLLGFMARCRKAADRV